jgi:hypothetical protein
MIETRVIYVRRDLREQVRRDLRVLRYYLGKHVVGKSSQPIKIFLPDQFIDYPPSAWRPLTREWFKPILILGKRLFLTVSKRELEVLFEKGYGRWENRTALALIVSPRTTSIMVAEGGKIKGVALRKAGARYLKILDGMVQAALNFLKAPNEFLRLMDDASKKAFMDLAVDLYLTGGALG